MTKIGPAKYRGQGISQADENGRRRMSWPIIIMILIINDSFFIHLFISSLYYNDDEDENDDDDENYDDDENCDENYDPLSLVSPSLSSPSLSRLLLSLVPSSLSSPSLSPPLLSLVSSSLSSPPLSRLVLYLVSASSFPMGTLCGELNVELIYN